MFTFYMCPWQGCGQIFHSGEQVPDTCPNCGKDPHAVVNEDGLPFTYTAEEIRGKIMIETRG